MSRRLQALNVVLAIVSIALAAGIVRTLIVRRAVPTPTAPGTATVAAPAPATENVDPGLLGYAARRDASSSKKRSTAISVMTKRIPIAGKLCRPADRTIRARLTP